jgi:hypothetical protein
MGHVTLKLTLSVYRVRNHAQASLIVKLRTNTSLLYVVTSWRELFYDASSLVDPFLAALSF